jgi:glucosamine-6-phosphate deaminase
MRIDIAQSVEEMGRRAAASAAEAIRAAIRAKGATNIILATGASQFAMLSNLVKADIDWSKVTVFHLDEYIGLPDTHPASFRKYLRERFAQKVKGLRQFNYVNGDAPDPRAECARLGALVAKVTIDVACIGIGENGHIAFNDPPADFETETPYLVVNLDEACRKQQLGEGWFATLDDVPTQAITMGVKQIMKSARIVCTVPDKRKAEAVKNTVKGNVSPAVPASILQRHGACELFLDSGAAEMM